jgi:hypothetical protein
MTRDAGPDDAMVLSTVLFFEVSAEGTLIFGE